MQLGISMVKRNGEVLGQTIFEPNVVVEDGRILTMSGQNSIRLGYRRVGPDKGIDKLTGRPNP